MCVLTLITQIKRSHDTTCYGYNKERHWLDNVDVLLEKGNLDADDYILWASFHAFDLGACR